jgi:hypothetical protein
MSHLHHIGGQSDIADHYRIFLERSQAARLGDGKAKVRKKSETDESELDPDENAGGDSQRDPENEKNKDSEGSADQTGSFGKHYA